MSDNLNTEIKELIIRTLRLKDMTPDQIDDDMEILGSGLKLDSLDALEIVVAVENAYDVHIHTNEATINALTSVNTLAAFIRANSPRFAQK